MKRLILMAGFALWATAALAVGVDEQVLPDPAQESAARDIMKDVRCLVCQNQSIEDSDADLARDLRAIVRERVAAGDDVAGVKSYLTARYGDWVLLRPPFNGRMLALWLAPFLIMVGGGIAIYRRTRIRRAPPPPLSREEEARLRDLLSDGPEEKS
ncbi:cytochrome c-type biogenesis protein [Govanella unica]|uniref:Cytochrome c-type biogenesis protein n=1 Tax=Govanella unica TaxID=2975056 RepID=A0A9X3TVY3_9PROT|nr:cytochrome c-type biogenesis protein [Govania unica]MDA5192715.1 cytochrome c-type biogenesis protein CcmH [Govania unica]